MAYIQHDEGKWREVKKGKGKARRLLTLVAISGLALLAAACNSAADGEETGGEGEKLLLVTTYSILADMVEQVAGERAEVYSMVPIGANPHEYEPLPRDVQKVQDADAIFYNGLNLEAGNGWFENLLKTAGKSGEEAPVYALTEGISPIYLESKGLEGQPDPHAWLDLQNGIRYVENVRDALIEVDPEGQEYYEERARAYIQEIEQLHQEIIREVAQIPEEQRLIVTSEGAFKYFGQAYGFETAYIWEINSENQGTPEQIQSIVSRVRQSQVPALFVETSVDRRSMETVSRETGVPIAGEVFTDSLAPRGEAGDTYLEMMRHNAQTFLQGLKGELHP